MIKVVGVVGSGAMGAGIAQVSLTAGYRVVLFDIDAAAAGRARTDILARLDRLVEKGQLTPEARIAAEGGLVVGRALEDLAPADLVIEAIVERLEPKQALFIALEKLVKPTAILATNTSSLPVAAIASRCQHKRRVCGLHFFNPVPVMRLVEVIATSLTSPDVRKAVREYCERVGKTAIEVRDSPGFLVNLGGRAYVTEAQHVALENVADYETIDEIMRSAAGFRMGPFELMDFTGIDVNFPATMAMWNGFQNDPRLKPTILQAALFDAGMYGRKTGRGFHAYGGEKEAPAKTRYSPAAGDRISVHAPERRERLSPLAGFGFDFTAEDEGGPIILSPRGEDATAAAARLGVDPRRCVAVDLLGLGFGYVTLMAPPGAAAARAKLADWFRKNGWGVAEIGDSPGFVAPRLIAMIGNLGCEMAEIGIAEPRDIDTSMKLAQNYPKGPLEWVEAIGAVEMLETLKELQAVTGSDRYRPSAWLRRRAAVGLSIYERG